MHLKFPLFLLWKPPYLCVYDVIASLFYTCICKMKQIRYEKNHSIFMYMSNITIKDHLYKKLCENMLKLRFYASY